MAVQWVPELSSVGVFLFVFLFFFALSFSSSERCSEPIGLVQIKRETARALRERPLVDGLGIWLDIKWNQTTDPSAFFWMTFPAQAPADVKRTVHTQTRNITEIYTGCFLCRETAALGFWIFFIFSVFAADLFVFVYSKRVSHDAVGLNGD